MKKMLMLACVAGMFLCVSCASNVDKLVDLKKEQAEALKELDLAKAAEIEEEVTEIMKNMTDEEKQELAKRLLE